MREIWEKEEGRERGTDVGVYMEDKDIDIDIGAPGEEVFVHMDTEALLSLLGDLCDAARSSRLEYERRYKLRLDRVSNVSNLQPRERVEVLGIWFKMHRLSQMYATARRILVSRLGGYDTDIDPETETETGEERKERKERNEYREEEERISKRRAEGGSEAGAAEAAEDGVLALGAGANGVAHFSQREESDEPNMTQTRELVADLLKSFPLKAPILIDKIDKIDKASIHDARNTIKFFHDSFSSRIKYAVEAAVGTFLLKQLVRQLRQCVELGRACPRDTWIRVLKSYKTLHCCLVTEAKDPQFIMFTNK